jgi:hypothetical protein
MATQTKKTNTPKPTGKVLDQVQAPSMSPDQAPATEQPKVAKPKVKRERSTLYASYSPVDTHVITVVPGCKGKKPNSEAGKRWAVLAQNSGKSVADIRAAYAKAGFEKRLRNDLRWNLAHNLVTYA